MNNNSGNTEMTSDEQVFPSPEDNGLFVNTDGIKERISDSTGSGQNNGLINEVATGVEGETLNDAASELQSSAEISSGYVSNHAEQIIELIEIGGPVVWILILMSIFSLSIVLIKVWQFYLLRPESLKGVKSSLSLWKIQQHDVAVKSLSSSQPVSRIVLHAMQGITANKHRGQLQEELSHQANALINQLRSFLRPLEVIASLSPLLGLMGTVLGMIIAFQQMEAAGNQVDPSVLSGGIWQALLTTAAGLAVAIPVAAAHSWLDRKVERVSYAINDAVTQVFISHSYSDNNDLQQAGNSHRAA